MLALVVLTSAILAPMAVQSEPVSLTVYYTSMCQMSQNLTKYQLVPAMEKLGMDNLKVSFVPFGTATYKSDGNGGYTFDCFWGRLDCMGNMMQACGLKMLGNDEQKKFQFISCVMSDCNPAMAGQKCSYPVGLDWEALKSCIMGPEGQQLLAAHGEKTMKANPAITKVPMTFINDVYSEKDNTDIYNNLIGTVCQYMKTKPAACN